MWDKRALAIFDNVLRLDVSFGKLSVAIIDSGADTLCRSRTCDQAMVLREDVFAMATLLQKSGYHAK